MSEIKTVHTSSGVFTNRTLLPSAKDDMPCWWRVAANAEVVSHPKPYLL